RRVVGGAECLPRRLGGGPRPAPELGPSQPVEMIRPALALGEPAAKRVGGTIELAEQQQVGADLEPRRFRAAIELAERDPVPVEETAGVTGGGGLRELRIEKGGECRVAIEIADQRSVTHLERGARRERREIESRAVRRSGIGAPESARQQVAEHRAAPEIGRVEM